MKLSLSSIAVEIQKTVPFLIECKNCKFCQKPFPVIGGGGGMFDIAYIAFKITFIMYEDLKRHVTLHNICNIRIYL